MFRHRSARNCKVDWAGRPLKSKLFADIASNQSVTVPPLQGGIIAFQNQGARPMLCHSFAKIADFAAPLQSDWEGWR